MKRPCFYSVCLWNICKLVTLNNRPQSVWHCIVLCRDSWWRLHTRHPDL
jgi:hypothetical protein